MKRTVLISTATLALLFAAVTLHRTFSRQVGETDTSTMEKAGEKERLRRFWSLHREAGQRRIDGAYEEAIHLYEAALHLDARHEDALYYVSNMYLEVGRLHDAERTLDQLTRFHPTSSRGFSRLGDLYLCFHDPARFDTERARTAYLQAQGINKEETGPLLRLAEVALIDGDLKEVRRLLDDILGTHSRSIEGHFLAGYVAWKQGDLPAASTLYEQALQLAHGDTPKEQVIGEGDRKAGAAMKPGEQLTCPTMLHLLQEVDVTHHDDAAPLPMHEAYRDVDRTLARLRSANLKLPSHPIKVTPQASRAK